MHEAEPSRGFRGKNAVCIVRYSGTSGPLCPAGQGAGFFPAGEVSVHHLVEGGAMPGNQQVREFMHDHVFNAYVREQQEVIAEVYAPCRGIAAAPSGPGGPVADDGRGHAHQWRIFPDQRRDYGSHPGLGFGAFFPGLERQAAEESFLLCPGEGGFP